MAEPERPNEKSGKRLASPTRGQASLTTQCSVGSAAAGGTIQHTPVSFYTQSSPSAKRKRIEQFGNHGPGAYVIARGDKDDKVVGGGGSIVEGHGAPSQVVLLPPQEITSPTDLTPPQPYASHHPSLATDGVLYSVAGTAIYVGTSQASAVNPGRGDLTGRDLSVTARDSRDGYSSGDQCCTDEPTVPGPSGVQTQHVETSMVNFHFSHYIYIINFLVMKIY